MRRRHCELLSQALEILTPSPWKSYTWKIRPLQADLKDLFVHSALAGSPKIYSMRSRCRHFINFFVLMLSEICWLMFIPLRGGWSVYRSLGFAHSEDKGTVPTEPTSEQYFLIHHCVLRAFGLCCGYCFVHTATPNAVRGRYVSGGFIDTMARRRVLPPAP